MIPPHRRLGCWFEIVLAAVLVALVIYWTAFFPVR